MRLAWPPRWQSRLRAAGIPFPLPTASAPTTAAVESAPSTAGISATVKIVPADQAELAFPVSGLVKDVIVSEGQAVRLGDPLIVLDAPEQTYAVTAAQEALKSAEADEFDPGTRSPEMGWHQVRLAFGSTRTASVGACPHAAGAGAIGRGTGGTGAGNPQRPHGWHSRFRQCRTRRARPIR